MKKGLLLGAGLVAIALTAQSTALGHRGGGYRQDHGAQNITRDDDAYRKARMRDWRGFWRRAFSAGREVRSMDGSGNNETDPMAGATFHSFQRMTYADYGDGIASMAGPLRKSPREISNIVIDQAGQSYPNTFGTSDFLWQWGQFIDHDTTLGDEVLSDDRSFDIPVPAGDPYFDPAASGDKVIRFDRAIYDPETGTDPGNPRQQMNELTSWIDGSMVYGNNDARAEALRTMDGTGRLRTSRGGLLPFNTDNLPNANGAAPDPTRLFLAGDVRANEQVGLTSMHTVFLREHNRWARTIKRMRPWLSGDDIYQSARRMVIAEIQIVTYEEFLPALIGDVAMAPYEGYDPGDPTIFTEFSGAAYRLGHTLINAQLMRLDCYGRDIPEGPLALRDAFFNAPTIIKRYNDIDPILRGLASQRSQAFDHMIVDDLRNFLFGPPGAGGFDLASLNIQRGRDRGLPSYNGVREALGLPRAEDFSDITSDPDLQQKLFQAYGTVDNIDLWVGGVSEDPMTEEGSQLGPLFRMIVAHQFRMLRDCDRFWWERDLTRAEQAMVKHVRLSDIIIANTGIRPGEIPANVFYVKEPRRKYGWGWRDGKRD